MATATLTRSVTFSAAHRYFRPEWSAERNREVFGPCANEHGHGHTYTCAVTVRGTIDSETAMVVDIGRLDALLADEVVGPMDHRHLNHDIDHFALGRTIPTAEAIAEYVWHRLAPRVPKGITLVCVRIDEDRSLSAEYCGDDG